MHRRDVLAGSAWCLGGLLVSGLVRSAGQVGGADRPLFRISLAEWSLHRALRAGQMDHLDFAVRARQEFGLDAVEYVNTFFRDRARDRAYLDTMRARAEDAGVRSLLIMIDGEGALADADATRRRQAVDNHLPWLEAAARLGCHSIRVNAAGEGDRESVASRAVESLRQLGELAAGFDLHVLVENHGGWSSDGAWLADVMRRTGHPRVGTLPDFGNFHVGGGVWYDRYRGVAELMPFARAVSAKSHDFDAEGNETHTDYLRMLRIVVEAGYRGYVGIEYEGEGLPEPEGIRRTRALLERVRAQLEAEHDHGAGS